MPVPLLFKQHSSPALLRYGAGIGIFCCAFGLRWFLLPVEARLAYATFTPAVLLCLYFLGLGPGLVVAGLSVLAGAFFFTPPYRSFEVDAAGAMAMVGFVSSSLLAAWVVSRLQRALRQERRATERAARSEQQLQHVVDDQTELLIRFDAKGHFSFANEAARRAFGLSDANLQSRTWHCLIQEADLPEVKRVLRGMTPDSPVERTESRYPGPDGRSLWGEFVHHAIYDENRLLLKVQTVGRDVTDRKQLQARLEATSALMQDLYDNAPCGYHSLDAQGRFIEVNRTIREWLGRSEEALIGKMSPRDFMSPEGQASFDLNFPKFLVEGQIGPLEFELLRSDGNYRRVSLTATAMRDEQGRFLRSRSVMYDVTELAEVRRRLEALTLEQNAMLDSELIGITKLRNRFPTWQNRGMAQMFGYAPSELVGLPARVLYPSDEAYRALGEAAYPVLAAGGLYRTQVQLVRKDGSPIWVDMSGMLLSRETGESMWMMLDITTMKAYEAKVEDAALHDCLTGLPNRTLLMQRLEQALAQASIQGHLIAVCFLDLDGFKGINDRHGHAAGDLLLQETASRLMSCIRTGDTAARLGGDEFVLLIGGLARRQECEALLQRIVARVAEPIALGGDAIGQISASMGVAFSEPSGVSVDQLLHAADAAMYRAKAAGKNRIVLG